MRQQIPVPSLRPAWLRRAALAAAAGLTLLTPLAGAQPVDELQDELARTRDELRAAESLIVTLREEIARLQSELRALRGEEPAEAMAEIPADPLACPASMAAELTRRYERDLGHLPKAGPGSGFEGAAMGWCERMASEIRGRREWLVSIDELRQEPGARDSTARIRVFDELSLLPLGGFEVVEVPARMAARIKAEPETALWLLSAEVSADPMYNPSRAERGAFDAPPFVGPHVESGFRLDWIGLVATDLVPPGAETPEGGTPLPQPPRPGPDR